ncbi:hypothetical protein NFI96_003362 [Prochilodus magdalenae]|nr:hypothetical protein NFI96_003362 [Prochilodus magdalenae]
MGKSPSASGESSERSRLSTECTGGKRVEDGNSSSGGSGLGQTREARAETERRQSFSTTSHGVETPGLSSAPVRDNGGRKFAFCAWSWWAFFCLHIHVSTAVVQVHCRPQSPSEACCVCVFLYHTIELVQIYESLQAEKVVELSTLRANPEIEYALLSEWQGIQGETKGLVLEWCSLPDVPSEGSFSSSCKLKGHWKRLQNVSTNLQHYITTYHDLSLVPALCVKLRNRKMLHSESVAKRNGGNLSFNYKELWLNRKNIMLPTQGKGFHLKSTSGPAFDEALFQFKHSQCRGQHCKVCVFELCVGVWSVTWCPTVPALRGDVAPYFKTEPGPPETHLEGNRLVMTCLAEGSWPLEFKWMFNSTDITAFSPEYKYIVPSLQRSDMGTYQCIVRNRMGALLQRRAEIQVAYMGDFVEAEQRKTVTQGRAAILNSPAVSCFPRPQVTWYRDGYKIIPSSRVDTGSLTPHHQQENRSKDCHHLPSDTFLGGTAQPRLLSLLPRAITLENQLVVLATAAADAGRYYVQAVNEKNGENKTSPSIYLNVAVLPVCVRVFAGVFFLSECMCGNGKYVQVIVCAIVSELLSASGEAFVMGDMDLIWSCLPQALRCSTSIITPLWAGKKDSEAPADPVAPVIVIPPRNTTVVAGVSEATLECVANARPVDKLSLVWRRNGVEVASGVGSFGRRLTIINPTSADVGLYVCEASLQDSSVKPAEAKAFLSIIEAPYFTAEPRRKMMGEVEKSVDIPCQARGVPMPKLEWYKDAVPLSKLNNPRYKVIPSMGLQVRKLQPNDAGIFQCFARNAAGEMQVHTYLDVTRSCVVCSGLAPAFTAPPANITVTDGSAASFTCQVSGAPKPAITWKRDAQILASGSVQIPRFTLLESGGLQVKPVMLQDTGTYICYAANTEGAINASASLTVWSRTYISHPPSDRRVIKGTTAILECSATHDPRVHVRFVWKKDGEIVVQSKGGRISLQDGSLHITQTWSGDIGDYTCDVLSMAGNDSKNARLEVIELPHFPPNLQARLNATDSRSVDLSWMRPFDGNSPLLHYVVELSENIFTFKA